jgi:putative flippase GtrA
VFGNFFGSWKMGRLQLKLPPLFKQSLRNIFSLHRPPDLHTQFARFLLGGGFSALIDFLLLVLLVEAFSVYYLVAGAMSFLVGLILNYFVSRRWIFQGGKYDKIIEFLVFCTGGAVGLGLNQIVLLVFVGHFSLDYRFSKIISVSLVTFWNFLTKKYLIFKN